MNSPPPPDFYSRSAELHQKHRGKIEIKSKVRVVNRDDLSLVYTPGVAEPCRRIHQNPADVYKYTNKGNAVAVVTDGSAVLGLGNIGAAAGLPVMEGKAVLFKEFGGVDAYPICLDTQDPDEIVKIVKAISPGFGGINLEDISAPRCFEVEERLIKELDIPVMHDDQHGTAIVVLAALINALKVTGRSFSKTKIVVNGVGAAGVAISKLLMKYGAKPSNFLLCDSVGTIYKGRCCMNAIKEGLAKITNTECLLDINHPGCRKGGLADIVREADVFIGVSKGKVLTPEMVRNMAKDPIVFAMANPEPEIMPEEAKRAGARIVASGRSDFPNQINNALVFPGLFRGVLDAGIRKITDEIKILAAETVAACVERPDENKIVPDLLDKTVPQKLARAIQSYKPK